jgi:hypothetical protein
MFTLFNLKIHTAALISLAFVFRILFVNMPLLSSTYNSQTNKLLTTHFSTTQKKRRQLQAGVESGAIIARTDFTKYEAEEIYEENFGGQKASLKVNSPILLFFLLALARRIVTPFRAGAFSSVNYYLYPKKYLALSNLRI